MKVTKFFQLLKAYSLKIGRRIAVRPDPKRPGFSIHSMAGNFVRVDSQGLGSAGNVSISADCLLSTDKLLGLCGIVLKCNSAGGCQMNGNGSFSLFIDGTKFVPQALESSYVAHVISIVGEKYTVEAMRYPVNKEVIARLFSAKAVGFEIKGKVRKIEGKFTKKNLARFRHFYESCLVGMKPLEELAASGASTHE